jgi:peptidoglycan/xylan/chitin deacetylase (PgdA/CDA1 family)
MTTHSRRRLWDCLVACSVLFMSRAGAGTAPAVQGPATEATEIGTVDPRKVRFEFPFSTYRQEVTIEFASEAFAQAAVVTPTPLWDGREWAVSSRWDDTVPENNRMREVLTEHGQRGTFYLNAWFRDWSDLTATPDSPYARALLEGGHSIGGHSLNHPWLSYCHRNRIFEEVAGIRMVWEAATDTPLNSFSFSYCDFRNEDEGDAVQTDIIRALERAGFYHIANEPSFEELPSELMLSPILPADGASIDAAAEGFLADPAYRAAHPILTYSMHAVYDTPAEWAAFEHDLDRFGHRTDWWYCNQTEYAAYRYQYLRTHIRGGSSETLSTTGENLPSDPGATTEPGNIGEGSRIRRLVLDRPVLLDLNDPIPLTFEIAGVPREAVTSVRCATATCLPSDRPDTSFRFHLFHNSDQALPSVITLVPPNTTNSALEPPPSAESELPGISAHLFCKKGLLRLRLVNRSSQPLTACRVTYRLPLAWNPGIVRRGLPNLTPRNGVEDFYLLPAKTTDYKHSAGNAFLAAQIDFRLGDQQVRVHTACHLAALDPDPSFPQSGFVRMGPFPRDQIHLPQLMADLCDGAAEASAWELADGSDRVWEVADNPFLPPHFDAERVRLSGTWSGWNDLGYYVIQSRVWSDTERTTRLRTTGGNFAAGIVLNGADVTGRDLVRLAQGVNSLTLVCSALPAFFLRMEDPETAERLPDIRYEFPDLPSPEGVPYLVPSHPAVRR